MKINLPQRHADAAGFLQQGSRRAFAPPREIHTETLRLKLPNSHISNLYYIGGMKKLLPFLLVCVCATTFAQTGSEIYLFDLKMKGGQVFLSGGINITNHKGYDNQPYFHPSQSLIYYSSFNDSNRSDIKYYNYQTKETSNLTLTNDREYSPTVTPDENFISCIIQRDNGAQDLGKYPLSGGEPEILINTLKIGYHAWAAKDKLLLFVLEDSNANSLHYYDLSAKSDKIIAKNIGRSLHKIPGQDAMSFVQKITDSTSVITRFDPATGATSPLAFTLKRIDQLTWLQNNIMLMSNGKALFSSVAGAGAVWKPVIVEGDASMLKGVTRLATNSTNTKLAVVVSE